MQLAAKHGVHQKMTGEWKRQAVIDLASVFSAKTEAKDGIGEGDLERSHAKFGQLVVERVLWQKPSVDECDPTCIMRIPLVTGARIAKRGVNLWKLRVNVFSNQ